MVKIKNVRPGILIIADAGLKLTPGESREVEELTPQTRVAISNGLLTQIGKVADKAEETKPKAKAACSNPGSEKPEEVKTACVEAEQTSVSDGDPEKAGEQSDPGKRRDAKQKQVVEAESGDK